MSWSKIGAFLALAAVASIFVFSALAFIQGLLTGSVWTEDLAKGSWWRNTKANKADEPLKYWFYLTLWGAGTVLGLIVASALVL
jgi:hypothetical protein